jgi:dimethylglycine dehydrogenase
MVAVRRRGGRAIRETAGLIDATAFAKHRVKGPGATGFLDWFTTNKLPKVGRINLTYALTDAGTTRTEYTIVRLAEDDYYLVSAGAWADYDGDYLRKSVQDMEPTFGRIEVQDVTTQWGVFALAGPSSRAILKEFIRDEDPATALSNKRFPWLSARRIELGMVPVQAIRVAYTGELGWELHHPIEMQNHLFDRLMAAGRATASSSSAPARRTGFGRRRATAPSATNWAATRRHSRPTCRASWTSRRTSAARRRCRPLASGRSASPS